MRQIVHLQAAPDDVRALCACKVNSPLHVPDNAELVKCDECWRIAKASGQKVAVAT